MAEMPKMKPYANFFSEKNIVKGKEVGDHVSVTVSGRVKSVSQSPDGYHVEIELSDSISKEQFEKMDSKERKMHMEESVLTKES